MDTMYVNTYRNPTGDYDPESPRPNGVTGEFGPSSVVPGGSQGQPPGGGGFGGRVFVPPPPPSAGGLVEGGGMVDGARRTSSATLVPPPPVNVGRGGMAEPRPLWPPSKIPSLGGLPPRTFSSGSGHAASEDTEFTRGARGVDTIGSGAAAGGEMRLGLQGNQFGGNDATRHVPPSVDETQHVPPSVYSGAGDSEMSQQPLSFREGMSIQHGEDAGIRKPPPAIAKESPLKALYAKGVDSDSTSRRKIDLHMQMDAAASVSAPAFGQMPEQPSGPEAFSEKPSLPSLHAAPSVFQPPQYNDNRQPTWDRPSSGSSKPEAYNPQIPSQPPSESHSGSAVAQHEPKIEYDAPKAGMLYCFTLIAFG